MSKVVQSIRHPRENNKAKEIIFQLCFLFILQLEIHKVVNN